MNLIKIRLWPYILFSLAMVLFSPVLLPSFRLLFFVPCIVVLLYQKPLFSCLWMSFGFGLLLDLLSADNFLGLHVTSYCATTALMYPQKKHFFADTLSTLPILTVITSLSITLFQSVIVYIFQKSVTLGAAWAFTNLVIMPLLDGVYAFTVFLVPSLIFGKRRRYGSDFFMRSSRRS